MKLPSIIRDIEFDERGLAKMEWGSLVPAYVASQSGFHYHGRKELSEFYERLREEADVLALCPFQACGENLDLSRFEKIKSIEDLMGFWDSFNRIVGPINYGELMPRSKLMIAILDGGHTVDDGVAAEIGYYAGTYKDRPIIGIRSDFRLSENPAAPINPALRYFIDKGPYPGMFFSGNEAYDDAIKAISLIASDMKGLTGH